jgi:hypothetical protein
VEDRKPPKNAREHAAIIKRRWKDYCIEDGRPAFVVVDARSYGLSVIEHLHEDLGDGLPPMRTMNNDPTFAMLVKDNAVPCLYALQASGSSGADPNTVMLDYIEREFENGNLRLLTQNLYEGLQAYKLKHDIKDDLRDAEIQLPYSATNRLARQISNLQKKYGAVGWTEQQINKYIQKDMWSALLYACRIAQRLEKSELYALNRRKNEWDELAKKYEGMTGDYAPSHYNKKRRSGRLAVKR